MTNVWSIETNTGQVTDDELAAEIKKEYQIEPGQKLSKERKEQRDELIQDVYESERTSMRQLAGVLGVSKGVVEKAL